MKIENRKRFRKSYLKIRKFILKFITCVMTMLLIFCGCCLDTENGNYKYVVYGCIIALFWLVPYVYVNYIEKY